MIDLPRDGGGARIQALRPDDTTTVVGTASDGNAVSLALPANSKLVEVSCSDNVHWRFATSGAVNATTSNKLQGPSALIYAVPADSTHISFIRGAGVTSVVVSVTRMY